MLCFTSGRYNENLPWNLLDKNYITVLKALPGLGKYVNVSLAIGGHREHSAMKE